jgi:hypothetical protein
MKAHAFGRMALGFGVAAYIQNFTQQFKVPVGLPGDFV